MYFKLIGKIAHTAPISQLSRNYMVVLDSKRGEGDIALDSSFIGLQFRFGVLYRWHLKTI